MDISLEKEGADKFVKELTAKLTGNGLYAMSKMDFYDFVIYLLDKYSIGHFLSRNSNFENACLLKISETKVKALKLNVNLKFREKSENDCFMVITNFLSKLTTANFISDEKRGVYIFVLDDKYTQMCIESVLKKSGTTLNYSFNSERVELEKDALRVFLNQYSLELDELFREKELSDVIKEICKGLLEKYVPASELIRPVLDITNKIISKIRKN